MNDKKDMLLLLQIIRVNGNILVMEKYGFSPADILKEINVLQKERLVVFDGEHIYLTSQGVSYYNSLCKELNLKGIYKYFIDDGPSRGFQMQLDQVYIPRKRVRK